MKHAWPLTDFYGITDHALSRGRDSVSVVRALLEEGVTIIQYREKERKMGVMLEECRAIRRLTMEYGATFIVNDHVDIAMLVDADGVHVGQDDMPAREARRLLGPDKIIGLSTHSPEQARAAAAAGVDYIGVGPIYATSTKKDVCDPVGLEYLKYVVENLEIPFVAIGGIKAANIRDVVRAGARCCAVVSAFVGADDIRGAVRAMRATAREAQTEGK